MWESLKQLNFISCCHDNLQIKDSTNQTIASHPHTPLALFLSSFTVSYKWEPGIETTFHHAYLCCGDLCMRWDIMSLISDEENIESVSWITQCICDTGTTRGTRCFICTCLYLTHVWCLMAYPIHQIFSIRAMEWSPACGRKWYRINSLSSPSVQLADEEEQGDLEEILAKASSDPPWVWVLDWGKFTCMPLRKICSTEELMKLESK